ncbi:LuxR C-terminal-related transcriptional regulator [Vibrio sinaloensis]|uniref:LuxR C-terminal-related transcriptional regulator n=1 Tax=Photobacterium sp. (strain ATCC 43367) TaxID=379097 RepID=UPI0035ECC53F
MVQNTCSSGNKLDVVLVGDNCIQTQFIRREIEKHGKYKLTRRGLQEFYLRGEQFSESANILLVSYRLLKLTANKSCDLFRILTTSLIVYDVPHGDADLELTSYAHLKGILYQDAPIEHLLRSLEAVEQGDLWLPRKLMVKMLSDIRPYALTYQDINTTLTKREQQTLERLVQGQSNLEIAEALFVAESTVKTHVYKLFKKLNVSCRKEAIHKVSSQYFERPEQ